MVALFVAVSLATASLTVVLLQHFLMSQLDEDVRASAMRVDGRPHPDGDLAERRPGGGESFLTLVLGGGDVYDNYVALRSEVTELTDAQVQRVRDAQLGPSPQTVALGGDLGDYRLVASRGRDGLTVVTGQPLSEVTDTVAQLVTVVVGGTITGLVAVGAGGVWLVRRNLAPLQRVAHTATRVSRLKLDSGDVALPERVPEGDTDPRTEVGQVGLALNKMLDNVDSALQARHESETRVRQFVADASHELRTPLASIRGYAELSRREPEPVPPTVTHALARVESEAVRMSALVEDLLLLARLDAGRPLGRDPVDLTMLAVDAVSDARAAAPDRHWRLDLPEKPVEVTGDAHRLHQVVANLLANARIHTPVGTTVTTTVRRQDGHVRIAVHDDGPGVPAPLQANVFERFTRADDSRYRGANGTRHGNGSTGLGLSIVAAVTQAHGGRVELDSHPGDTTFAVTLPA
ncbi:HAMP domain-containing sensor histidine kinase [Knoellia sp. p5-6-4]|uniref:sensor histidine kinase n=1 Tax=unclassified Knoellia TaxID=2618719 RepID=UPI0023DA5FC9|nr:HAMP domain-containing sensor histidine kinase [Knoellia sp. p5-6-4]MDF2144854.1 HAMP domain-containing sensor histidine kinase [Knoellia sp. p5-6-4]